MSHSAPEEDRIAMLHAALVVSGTESVVSIKEPLPVERRQHLYAVADEHDLGKKYGISKLSAILSETKIPHLVDYEPSSARKGLRYVDNQHKIPEELAPFVSDEARRAWRDMKNALDKENQALSTAAQKAQHQEPQKMMKVFPDPAAPKLKIEEKRPISSNTEER